MAIGDAMSLRPTLRSALHFVGVIVFIALGALAASRARSDPLTEVYLLGLISVGILAIVVGAGPAVRETGDAAAAEFERRADAALAAVLNGMRDQAAAGEKFGESLAGANRKLARLGSYETLNEIVLTLINDNRAMQTKVNGLTEKLEQSRFKIMRLRSSLNKAEEIGSRDSLTGLGNRRYFDTALGEEVERAHEEGKAMCVSLADIDHFKAINDRFGHMAGDVVLKRFADLLSANIKGEDKVARFGGEEFAIIFPDADLADATAIVNQIHKQLGAKRWAVAASGERLGVVTASFGVARLRDGESADELLRRVDAKLYEAKANGRNRVMADESDAVINETAS
jgi:diguanylate cyclase